MNFTMIGFFKTPDDLLWTNLKSGISKMPRMVNDPTVFLMKLRALIPKAADRKRKINGREASDERLMGFLERR